MEKAVNKLEGIEFRILKTEADVDTAFKLISSVFDEREVTNICFGIKKGDLYNRRFKYLIEKYITDDYNYGNIGAFDSKRGEMAGCLLSGDFSRPVPVDLSDKISEEMRTTYKWYAQERTIALQELNTSSPNKIYFMNLVATSQDYANRGIATQLFKEGHKIAKARGFEFCFTQVSSAFSQRIALETFKYDALRIAPCPIYDKERAENMGIQDPKVIFSLKKVAEL